MFYKISFLTIPMQEVIKIGNFVQFVIYFDSRTLCNLKKPSNVNNLFINTW